MKTTITMRSSMRPLVVFKCELKLANKCQAIFEKNWIVKKGNFNKHHSR